MREKARKSLDFGIDSAGEGNLRGYDVEKKTSALTGGPVRLAKQALGPGRQRQQAERGEGARGPAWLGGPRLVGGGREKGPGGKLGWLAAGFFPLSFSSFFFYFIFFKAFFQIEF